VSCFTTLQLFLLKKDFGWVSLHSQLAEQYERTEIISPRSKSKMRENASSAFDGLMVGPFAEKL
jgi:hypothetical protein